MSLKDFHILVVDDDHHHLQLLEKTLGQLEIPDVRLSIQKADCYDQSVESIKVNFPDLVVLDIILGGLSGLYVAAFITAHAINHDFIMPKIIFNSGGFDNQEEVVRKAKLLNATFLWKPLDLNVLKDAVTKAILEKYPDKPLEKADDLPKAINGLTKDQMGLIRDLEHYVAHLIMELQFFRTKMRDLDLGAEEHSFLDEMFEIETKTIKTFEKLKKEFF